MPDTDKQDASSQPKTEGFPFVHLGALAGLVLVIIVLWPDDAPRSERVIVVDPPMVSRPAMQKQAAELNPEEALALPQPLPQPTVPPDTGLPVASDGENQVSPDAQQVGQVSSPRGDPVATQASQPVVRESVPVAAAPLTGLDAELGYQREDWLLTRSETEWVLQLLVTSDEKKARRALDQLGADRRRGAYYRAERNGRVVYVVLLTGFTDRQTAVAAEAGLPAVLRSYKPFPKAIALIFKEISGQ